MDSNSTRMRRSQYAQAFKQVFGDPFEEENDESGEGWYTRFKSKGILGACSYALDEGSGTANPARPSVYDFYIDADNVLRDVIKDDILLQRFHLTVIMQDVKNKEALTPEELAPLIQRIGRLLRVRRIAPVNRYFTTIRRAKGEPVGTNKRQ